MTATQHPYTVKNIKSFEGREGLGFNANLYRDGRKVAFVIDEANGGQFNFRWLAATPEARNADEFALNAYCATLPPHDNLTMDADLFLAVLVDDAENAKRIASAARRGMKRHVLFVQGGHLRQTKAPPTPALIEQVSRQYPDAIVLNALAEADAIAAYRTYGVQIA